jgi:hypothetical protein
MPLVPVQLVRGVAAALVLAIGLAGCGMGDELLEEIDPFAVPATVTYDDHIRPRMEYYCVACHHPGGPLGTAGGWDFSSYELVKASFETIQFVTFVERRMPPGAARRMDGRDRAFFSRWKSSGFPEKP